jgi:hypothetical protein
MDWYSNGSDEDERVRMIEDILDRRRTFEGEEWLAGKARRMSTLLERVHQG